MAIRVTDPDLVYRIESAAASLGIGETALIDLAITDYLDVNHQQHVQRANRIRVLADELHRSIPRDLPSLQTLEADLYDSNGLPR